MHVRRSVIAAITSATGLLVAGLMLTAPGASAVAPRLQVSPSAGLNPDGATVTVRGSGFATGGNGIYVGWCRVVPSYWTSQGNCADARWVHRGGNGSGQAPLSSAGSFQVQLRVSGAIGGHSCLSAGACKVLTMAAHGSSDRSQDSFAAVSFAAPATRTASSSTAVAATKSTSAKKAASSSAPKTHARTSTHRPAPRSSHVSSVPPTSAAGTTANSSATTSTTAPPTSTTAATTTTAASTAAPRSTTSLAAVQAAQTTSSSGGIPAAVWIASGVALVAVAGGAGTVLIRRHARGT